MPAEISVVLAAAQFLTRKALKSLIEELPGFRLAAQTDAPEELQGKIAGLKADLLVVELFEEAPAFMGQLEKMKQQTAMQVLIISNSAGLSTIQHLIKAGIKGIVDKSCSEREIVNALRAVSIGNRFYCNSTLNLLIEKELKQEEEAELSALSARELQVLKLIAKGCTSQKIAESLHISVHTVNSHRKNILKKLHISSPIHLLAFVVEKGLVSLDYPQS